MGDEPQVSNLVIQWRPDTTDLYRSIKIIREDHRSGDALCYPLLFPNDTYGWTLEQRLYTVNVRECQNGQVVDFERLEVQARGTNHRITPKEFFNYRLMPRHGSPKINHLFSFRHLFQDFFVVCYKNNVARNLKQLKMNQPSIRAHNYGTLQDQLFTDNVNEGGEGIRGAKVILPLSYVGSPRYMSGKFHDALYMCTRLGCPSFFIIFTANPKCPEIVEAIHGTSPTATSSDRSDIIARVFKLKLDELMHYLIHKQVMGRLAGISMVIEYQKPMLPHAHIVVIIHPDDRHKTAEDIDTLVSTEIPREPTDDDNEETR
jgi:hypothetical protein